MTLKMVLTKPEHEVAYQDLVALMVKHPGLSKIEVLTVAANIVGKIVAMQDQRTHTAEQIMAIVGANIEHGNRQVIEGLANAPAGRA